MSIIRTCRAGGCTRSAMEGSHYCMEHQDREMKDRERRFRPIEAQHGINSELYHSYKWKVMRQNQLKRQPLCEKCGAEATEVHHTIPPKGDPDLFFDESNLMSLCHTCHFQETRREMQEAKASKVKNSGKLWY